MPVAAPLFMYRGAADGKPAVFMESFQCGIKNSGRATSDSFDLQHSHGAAVQTEAAKSTKQTRKEQKNTANVLVNRKDVRRTH